MINYKEDTMETEKQLNQETPKRKRGRPIGWSKVKSEPKPEENGTQST
jgi:hypothetical protein